MPTSLFALLDDLTLLLDDVATLTKVAAKKTAGVLGDDLALNAQQVAGVESARELPVVWAVAKGSAINKAVLVPAALALSALAPWAVTPALMLGGLYLCYEGVEKLAHRALHPAEAGAEEDAARRALSDPAVDLVAFEREKIRGAIRTDFILSAEIITISLASVAEVSFGTRVAVLVAVSVLMTAGVYGLVAGIVKLDDLGLALSRRPSAAARALGRAVLAAAPRLMKLLSVAGTAAMFLVGGGILAHGLGPVDRAIKGLLGASSGGGALRGLGTALLEGAFGVAAGALALAAVLLVKRLRRKAP
jgi:predicted DNA repair protein MutK